MDRRTILAIVLSFAVFYGWQKLYIEPRLPKPGATVSESVSGQNPALATNPQGAPAQDASLQPSKPKAVSKQQPFKSVVLGSETANAEVSNGYFWIKNWTLARFKNALTKDAPAVSLKDVDSRDAVGNIEFSASGEAWAYLKDTTGELKEFPDHYRVNYEDENVRWTRAFPKNIAPNGAISFRVEYDFKQNPPSHLFLSIRQRALPSDPDELERGFFVGNKEEHEKILVSKLPAREEYPEHNDWIAAQNHYFLLALKPSKNAAASVIETLSSGEGRVSLSFPLSGNQYSDEVSVFFGPKEINTLRAVTPGLDKTIDFGIFFFVAYPIFLVMKWIFGFVGNWGVAIILLTVLIKILLYPLVVKSMVSMKKMAALQPEINKLKEKHANDKEAQNRELMLFMKTKGYNPISGCLPILLQMPVFFALYRVLSSSIELYHAPFALHIHDLSQKDPYYIFPVVLTGVMYVQQKMTPTNATMDPAQQKMLQFMPLIFGVFMLNLAAGLSLYMLVNTVVSIAQQMWLNRVMDAKAKA